MSYLPDDGFIIGVSYQARNAKYNKFTASRRGRIYMLIAAETFTDILLN